MKKILLLALVSLASFEAVAQGALQEGKLQANLGLGFSGWGTPVYVGLDYGIAEDFTVGFEGSYRSYDQTMPGGKFSSTIIGLGVNGNYHFDRILELPKEWNLYAGLGLGYYIWSTKFSYDNPLFQKLIDNPNPMFAAFSPSLPQAPNSSGIGFGAQAGVRYFFTDQFAVNLELGGASTTSGAKIGITYKFGSGGSKKRYSEMRSTPAPAQKTTTTPASKPTPKKKK